MARWLTWIANEHTQGWACSQCEWMFATPSLLSDPEAKQAYDRLASSRFQEHDCGAYRERAKLSEGPNLIERARKLVMRGYKPKDAVELSLQEVELEFRSNPQMIERAKAEAEDFLRRVKQGLL